MIHEMMHTTKAHHVSTSAGYACWKEFEKTNGRRSLSRIARETGLNPTTVRRVLSESGEDISGIRFGAVAILAEYFGVPIDDMVARTATEGDSL